MHALEIRFCPMPSVPKGDYTAEASLFFKKNMVKDREFASNYKQAVLSSHIKPVKIDGSPKTLFGKIRLWFAKKGLLRSGLKLATDPTYEYALFQLVEKHPNIDYWTNIRVDRTVQGRKSMFILFSNFISGNKNNPYIKTGMETVKITATGIDVLTDAEYEAFKKTPAFEKMKDVIFPPESKNMFKR